MNDRDRLLIDALKRLRRIEQRMATWEDSEADEVRLALDHVYGLIENEIDCRIREEHA